MFNDKCFIKTAASFLPIDWTINVWIINYFFDEGCFRRAEYFSPLITGFYFRFYFIHYVVAMTAPISGKSGLFFFTLFLLQWFTWAQSLLTPFLVFWLHNYRIIASLYLTQQGVLNHWNREITDWDGMICWSQRYYRLLPPLWWENRQEGGRVSAGRSSSTLHQPTACSCVYTETSTKAPTHIWRFVAMDTRRGRPSQKIELN